MGPPTPESAVIANPSLSLLVIRVTELLTPPHYLTNAKRGYTQPSPRTRFEVLDARRSSPSGVCLLGIRALLDLSQKLASTGGDRDGRHTRRSSAWACFGIPVPSVRGVC